MSVLLQLTTKIASDLMYPRRLVTLLWWLGVTLSVWVEICTKPVLNLMYPHRLVTLLRWLGVTWSVWADICHPPVLKLKGSIIQTYESNRAKQWLKIMIDV